MADEIDDPDDFFKRVDEKQRAQSERDHAHDLLVDTMMLGIRFAAAAETYHRLSKRFTTRIAENPVPDFVRTEDLDEFMLLRRFLSEAIANVDAIVQQLDKRQRERTRTPACESAE
jgi:hypothetical protein